MESAVNKNLQNLLEYLGDVVDSDRQAKIEDLHRRALNWEPVDRLPVIVTLPVPGELRFAPYPHGQVFESPEKMLFNELVYAFNTSIASRDVLGDDLPCTIRANFGTVVIASVFGACVEQIDDNPPWIRHNGEKDISLEEVLDHDPLDGEVLRCVDQQRRYTRVVAAEDDDPIVLT